MRPGMVDLTRDEHGTVHARLLDLASGPSGIVYGDALAGDLGLHVTGASDYHGDGAPQRLGACTTAPDVLDALLAEPTHRGIVRP